MSRPLRIEYPGAWYHVMNRGRRGEEIFTEKNDYKLFLEGVKESTDLFTATSKSLWTIIEDLHMFVKYGLFLSIGGNIFEEER